MATDTGVFCTLHYYDCSVKTPRELMDSKHMETRTGKSAFFTYWRKLTSGDKIRKHFDVLKTKPNKKNNDKKSQKNGKNSLLAHLGGHRVGTSP